MAVRYASRHALQGFPILHFSTLFSVFEIVISCLHMELAIHIHVQARTNRTACSNGTIVTGNTASTGQLYFTEELEKQIMALEPYALHTAVNRTADAANTISFQDTEGRFNAVVGVVPVDGRVLPRGYPVCYVWCSTIAVHTTEVEEDEYLYRLH
ncbi:hypothetical protein BDV10DRAFT_183367 [Aspergillus recurvatus]